MKSKQDFIPLKNILSKFSYCDDFKGIKGSEPGVLKTCLLPSKQIYRGG
jgi:hypothetical protein